MSHLYLNHATPFSLIRLVQLVTGDLNITGLYQSKIGHTNIKFLKTIQAGNQNKFKHAALRYEVAVCIQTGDIVWINGPFRANRWPGVNIFRRNLKNKLLPGEMVEADQEYRDLCCRQCDVVVSKKKRAEL